MFLVQDKIGDAIYLVFTWGDPRRAGYTGDVIDDVSLDYDMEEVHRWPNGEAQPEACVGHASDDGGIGKNFEVRWDRQAAGFEPVLGDPVVIGSWSDYLKLRIPDPAAR